MLEGKVFSGRGDYADQINRLYGKRVFDFTFEVTEDCTLRCTYCYQHGRHNKKDMSFETAKRVVDLLFQEDEKDTSYFGQDNLAIILSFIGGEPLLKIDLIDQICDYFFAVAIKRRHRWYKHAMISISTNGTLYQTDQVRAFVKKWRPRLSMTITMDGHKELHDTCRVFVNGEGSYDVVYRSFLEHAALTGNMDTKLTLAPESVSLAATALKHFISLGATTIHANCVYEADWTYEDGGILYHQLKEVADFLVDRDLYSQVSISFFDYTVGRQYVDNDQNWCGGNGQMMAVNSDGEFFPCHRFLPLAIGGSKELPSMAVGHIGLGIAEAYEHRDSLEELRVITRTSQSPSECNECPVQTGCGWCTAHNYEEHGTVNRRSTKICPMHKARALATVYFWNRVAIREDLKERFPLNLPKSEALRLISEDEYQMLSIMAKGV